MWLLLIAELAVSTAFIGLLALALRRYDRHLSRIERDFDRDRDDIIAGVRARVDASIAELKGMPRTSATEGGNADNVETAHVSHLAGSGHGVAIQPPLEIPAPVRANAPTS